MAFQGSEDSLTVFKKIIWDYYRTFGRIFDWRQTDDPYHIVVSEIMLQQTQTHRISQKYQQFVAQFPTFEALANASIKDVITAWSGLGYNRRALYLQRTAQIVVIEYNSTLPASPEILVTLPGIGKATAASICAFAFNRPTIFIETNIRTVYLHFFFQNKTDITDAQLLPIIEQTVEKDNARHWYYALMDYGVMLKQHVPNPSRRSAHHTVQSKFEGSDRQIRGAILRLLTQHVQLDKSKLIAIVNKEPERTEKIMDDLVTEGFIINSDGQYKLKE